MEKLIRLNVVAKNIGIDRQTLKRWMDAGKGPRATRTPGGLYMFKESDIKTWAKGLETIEPNS